MSELLPRRGLVDPRAAALAALLDPLTARVREAEIQALAGSLDPAQPVTAMAGALELLHSETRAIDGLRARAEALRLRILEADEVRRQVLVAEHLEASARSARSLRRDLGAAARGQLDVACLLEREAAAIDEVGTRMEIVLRLLPRLADEAVRRDEEGTVQLLGGGGGLRLLATLAATEARAPTRRAAVASLVDLLLAHGLAWGLQAEGLALLQRLSLDPAEDPWIRRAALRVVRGLPPREAQPLLAEALADHHGPDSALLRAEAAAWIARRPELAPEGALAAIAQDDSELVRFVTADGLGEALAAGQPGAEERVRELLQRAEERTRARLAWALGGAGQAGLRLLGPLLADVPLVARTAMDAAIAALLGQQTAPQALVTAIAEVPEEAPVPLRRRAALLDHLVRAAHSPAAALAASLAALPEDGALEVRLPAGVTSLDLAHCLVGLAHEGFGFWLEPHGGVDEPGLRVRVSRGERTSPTLWRVLDELRQPAPAKRQAHTHAIGRADLGQVRVPPARLAEATPTGVPGQRIRLERQDGWAPEVPMVDDLRHALRRGEVLIVSALGTTRVRAPRRARRLAAMLRITWAYRALDLLRSAALDSEDARVAASWDVALDELGFQVERPRAEPPIPAEPPEPGEPPEPDQGPAARSARAWLDPITFAISMQGSTLTQLGVVVVGLAAVLFGRLSWARYELRRARAALPLVLGGWGTRGKSGTERLKAALMESLGIPFVSKTTGCEAMILHAPPGGHARELFLYRPYDKATIWEQAEVATVAPALGARVLLWECMALNPHYVELLQAHWMRDDVATLTNAFPDHEDIQGPTGQDVARVIGGFAPPGRQLLTTEEGMLAILRSQAQARQTTLTAVPRARFELMPQDMLARFRHREHPANVALVATLAEGLGIGWVEAVGFMAERVVADVGALVVHAPVPTEGRMVTFAQGQSANDPLSFRHSWITAGFEEPCPAGQWRISIVNNRADRVARSRMFAGLLADTASAHRHVLIGTNLQGLRSYLYQAVDAHLQRTDLDSPTATARVFAHLRIDEPGALGDVLARRLGAPRDAREAWRHVVAALEPGPLTSWGAAQERAQALAPAAHSLAQALRSATPTWAEELVTHLLLASARYLAFQAALAGNRELRARLYRSLVEASLVIVADSGASGDQIIDTAVHAAPPGTDLRLMGLQNIKGTGLDFAYRWVEWGEVHASLAALAQAGPEERGRILGDLGTRNYGCVMVCDGVLAALASDEQHVELRPVMQHVALARQALIHARTAGSGRGGPLASAVTVLERMLDPFHGIVRRRRGRRILEELAAMRISHDQAQRELKHLVDEQKGGWLLGGKH